MTKIYNRIKMCLIVYKQIAALCFVKPFAERVHVIVILTHMLLHYFSIHNKMVNVDICCVYHYMKKKRLMIFHKANSYHLIYLGTHGFNSLCHSYC